MPKLERTVAIEQYMLENPPPYRNAAYWQKLAKRFNVPEPTLRHIAWRMRVSGQIPAAAHATAFEGLKDDLKEPLYRMLLASRKLLSLTELCDHFDVGPTRLQDALASLHADGKNVQLNGDGFELSREIPRATKPTIVDLSATASHTFGVTADNHLGSKYERMDILEGLFDVWQARGVKTVYQLGNMIEGERHSKTDIHTHTLQGQVDYFVKTWPRRPGITTCFVTGDDHEGWYVQDEGINIGKFMELTARAAGRDDMVFLGHMEHDITLKAKNGSATMRLIHAGGGSSYAMSYALQKIVESYTGGEKPHILLAGHYHKIGYFYPREVHAILAGCTKDQDSFLRKMKIPAHLGGWTITVRQNDKGVITGFAPEVHTAFNLGFYGPSEKWLYKW